LGGSYAMNRANQRHAPAELPAYEVWAKHMGAATLRP
jgi:hypothetical protein